MPETAGMLKATAEVTLEEPLEIMTRLCAHFVEHGEVRVEGRRGRIETAFGRAGLEAGERSLRLVAQGRDDATLAYVKLSLAEHIIQFAKGERPRIVWRGDGAAAGVKLPYFRELTVTAARQVTPRMRRLTLAGENLGRFAAGGLHVRLLLPKGPGALPVWPVTGEDGRPSWPEGAERPEARVYTIRRIDVAAGEVDVDFVLHDGDCPGAGFARRAVPGDRVGMTGPGGGATPQADWLLLAGDETALPAIARILEELPAESHAVVRLEVADKAEEQPLDTAARLDLEWLHRGDAEAGTTTLIEDAMRRVEWPRTESRLFAWAGLEHRSARAIRSWLRNERKVARDSHLVVAYWRRGAAGDKARGGDD